MPAKKRTADKPRAANQVRIIGGQWRSRKLLVAEVSGLRPTSDRLRETLFNWLSPVIGDSRCLDLFAGSGALGLEALSRGARECWLLEKNSLAFQQLQANCSRLQAAGARLIQADSLSWLGRNNTDVVFDMVFIDPPFATALVDTCCTRLEAGNWLQGGAHIYLEVSRDHPVTVPANWSLLRDKSTGGVCARLYRRQPPD